MAIALSRQAACSRYPGRSPKVDAIRDLAVLDPLAGLPVADFDNVTVAVWLQHFGRDYTDVGS